MNITFIIPSLGRDTLLYTIDSLKNQTIQEWNAIIIFDNVPPLYEEKDPRIQYILSTKKGFGINQAGDVRNYGITFVTTPWVAFLDDDDQLEPNYIETFYHELENFPDMDVCIFRMKKEHEIIPKLWVNDITIGNVGISFIMKKNILDRIPFQPSETEDFFLLNQVRKMNYKIILSPYILYKVRDSVILPHEKKGGNRLFINYNNSLTTLLSYLALSFLEK